MRKRIILSWAVALAAVPFLPGGDGLGQTVGQASTARTGSPVVGLPGQPGRVQGDAVRVSLGVAPLVGLPSLPSVRSLSLGAAPEDRPAAAPSLPVQSLPAQALFSPGGRDARLPASISSWLLPAAPIPAGEASVDAAPSGLPAAVERRQAPGSSLPAAVDNAAARGLSAVHAAGLGLADLPTPEDSKAAAGRAFGESVASGGRLEGPLPRESVVSRVFKGLLPSRWRKSAERSRPADAIPEGRGAPQAGSARDARHPASTASRPAPPGPAAQAAPAAPPKASSFRNLMRGAAYGVLLVAAPIASSFALDPVDQAFGLEPFALLKYLVLAHPAVGIPLQYVWMGLSVLVPLLGLLAVRKGIKAAAPRWHRLALVLGVAGLAAAGWSILFLHSPLGLLALLAFNTVVSATGEEVMFRRGVFAWLRKRFEARGGRHGLIWAVALSSVVFSLMHLPGHGFTMNLFVLKALLGVVLALLYHRTGNLAVPAAAHSVYNLLVTFLAPLVGALQFLPFAGLASIAVLGVAFLLLRFLPRPKVPAAA